MKLYGFVNPSGLHTIGHAEDVVVSSTLIQIPAFGVGPLADGVLHDTGAVFQNLRINLDRPLSNPLTVDLKNITAGTYLSGSLGNFVISAGNVTGSYSGSGSSASQGDQLALVLKTNNATPELIPEIQWYTF